MSTITKYKFLFSMLLMFAAGATSGALVAWPAAKRTAQPKKPSMEHACDSMKHKLESRLHLTREQIQKISPRMERTARELDAVHEKSMVEIEEVFQRSTADISKELTPDQQPLLLEMERERIEFFQHRHSDRGPHHSFPDGTSSAEKTNPVIY